MEQSKSFFEIAEKETITDFNPGYTEEFQSFLEESIRQSDSANRDAVKSAATLVINC